MSMLEQVLRGLSPGAQRILLYGLAGLGKSSFAAMAEKPIFIQTEDGLGNIDCARFPLAQSLGDVLDQLAELYTQAHEFRTVVIDSLDWLERLIFADVCREHRVKCIDDIGYQKGYTYALTRWQEVLCGLDGLRRDKGMTVILIAHAKIERFNNPDSEPYDRYMPRLHKLAAALLIEWSDEVLFATYKTQTRKTGEAFGKARHIGVGSGERVLRTTERPAHIAKNRLNLPDELALDYDIFAAYVRGEPIQAEPNPTPEGE